MSTGQPVVDAGRLRALGASLSGRLILPGDASYESARLVWNRAADRRPAAIARCVSADDVARTIAFARRHGLEIAVRGGGHNQAGHGTCDDGIVIDTGGMRQVEVDAPRRSVRAGGGVRVSELLAATNAHGLVTPSGGCPDVGIGGLTLGGGESLLMARYGAACDNLLAADVVTADGEVRRASAEGDADLFWALRGGGGNVGVVTSFEYRLVPLREVLAGFLLFPLARTTEVIRRYRDLVRDAPDELETSGGLTPQPDGPMLAITLCHCGERAAADALVSRWHSALAPVSDTMEWRAYSAELEVPPAPSTGPARSCLSSATRSSISSATSSRRRRRAPKPCGTTFTARSFACRWRRWPFPCAIRDSTSSSTPGGPTAMASARRGRGWRGCAIGSSRGRAVSM